ncbi:probable receptor-like protein kinase At2g42960 [Ziziphus jujuba]|uniref:non-specific serine/threonine protein kinase n=1 Tax=Ziziphus jujuba TaxID=326968 RepID=A0ABM3IAZ4_ZIZJJ|nr:probable receptor-like protein kinase At2g42960 [Ziziphus jujuba]
MKRIYNYSLITISICLSASFVAPLDDPQGKCELDFTSYPYQPSGECILKKNEKIKAWNSIPTTRCCRNVLITLTQALAHRANETQGSIFVEQDVWTDCSIAPFRRQNSSTTLSINSCGFDQLYYNSKTKCSNLTLTNIQLQQAYNDAVSFCSRMNNEFQLCSNCSSAVLTLKNALLEFSRVKNNNKIETQVCAIAAVISVAAHRFDNVSFIQDFYGCLAGLDEFDSLAEALFAIVMAVIILGLIIVVIKRVSKERPRKRKQVKSKETAIWSGLYRFSKAEIEKAINFGNEKKCLGRGSAGQVYRGVLPSGQFVAVKHIYKNSKSDSFTREVEGLSRIRHPNLVCLFGCCIEGDEHYLVYEYCSQGNLAQHLLRKDTALTWARRVRILRDCALALRFLHHYIDGCIVHRDIKLTNILLTDNLEPKLSDFGLAKMLGMEESKVFTDVRGTIGYMDPEYMSNAKLTCASDIYSFGIVALQLLSGQKAIELDLDARDQLTRKAKDVSMGKRPLSDFEDPRLHGEVNRADFESILQIAVLCVAKSSKGRPTIDVVFDEMEKAWKNTLVDMRDKQDKTTSSATSLSGSMEILPV